MISLERKSQQREREGERQRERDRERQRETEGERERASQRERESEPERERKNSSEVDTAWLFQWSIQQSNRGFVKTNARETKKALFYNKFLDHLTIFGRTAPFQRTS